MKKWLMLLCCVLALNLAACGAKEEGAADRVGAQGALHFEVATQVYFLAFFLLPFSKYLMTELSALMTILLAMDKMLALVAFY